MNPFSGKEAIGEKRVKRVAMVVFSYYPSDQRVRREAEALGDAGMSVDVFCLRGKGEERNSRVNNLFVYRIPLKRKRAGKFNYLWEIAFFIFLAFMAVSFHHLRKSYHVIHVHNMPDILVISALIPRLTGAKVILDLHDPMPEIYVTKFKVNELHPVIRLIKFLEKICIGFADIVLTPNIGFRDLFVRRGCPPWKIHIVMNTAQETIFKHDPGVKAIARDNGFVIMYHGTILDHNGLDLALEAIASAKDEIPGIKFEVYGDGDFRDEFLKLLHELKLDSIVEYHGYKPVEYIAKAIKSIALGVIPNKMSCFTNLNLPVRIFEYLAMKKPVIVPRTQGIKDYFDEDSLLFFEAGNVDSLKNTILDVHRNPSRCQSILARGIEICNGYRWELEKKHFVELVEHL